MFRSLLSLLVLVSAVASTPASALLDPSRLLSRRQVLIGNERQSALDVALEARKFGEGKVTIMNSVDPSKHIQSTIKKIFRVNDYREIKVQVINNKNHVADHLVVYLFSKLYHKVELARVDINENFTILGVRYNYRLTKEDKLQQPGIKAEKAVCPDATVQFITFAPNDDAFEDGIAESVAVAAESHGLKTVRMKVANATRTNYLNYMACPLLEGNFYDGDANPDLITTNDGTLSSDDINTILSGTFRYKVVNIWLACEAFNDPMKSAMLVGAQSQKYAAGINDLLIGPSDKAAACAMIGSLNGTGLQEAFNACLTQLDDPADQWGFGGTGSDVFGH